MSDLVLGEGGVAGGANGDGSEGLSGVRAPPARWSKLLQPQSGVLRSREANPPALQILKRESDIQRALYHPLGASICALSQDLLHHVAVHVSEAEVAACILEGEAFVIEAEEVQNGGVHVMHVHLVLDGGVAKFVCLAK